MSRFKDSLPFIIGMLVAIALSAMIVSRLAKTTTPAGEGFASRIDLTPLDEAAVYADGRLKSFDSFAHEMMGYISGPRRIAGNPNDFAYIDLMLRPERYQSAAAVYVKKKPMRQKLIQEIRTDLETLSDEQRARVNADLDRFMDTGLISRTLLDAPRAQALQQEWRRDLIRTAKFADRINTARNVMEPATLRGVLRIVPPPTGDEKVPWLTVADIIPAPAGHGGAGAPPDLAAEMDPELRGQLVRTWRTFERAWIAENADQANAALEEFCAALPLVAPDLYPTQVRLKYESWYFKLASMTWVWVLYLLAVAFFLMSIAYKWRGAHATGMGLFTVALLLHTGSIGLRWWISGRWPNSNMFEAVTTAFWMGAAIAFIMEILVRKGGMRSMFALGASVASMFAMMAAYFTPKMDLFFTLDPNIRNMMPVLHDIWLYIHTNVIIASYAIIFMAAVTGALYLIRRALGGPADHAPLGGTAALLRASMGTAKPNANNDSKSLGEVLDGATMVLIELSFVLLWAGIIMGAIWADHSWGRPWGWDPKEVFALNTFLVYLILVHVRIKSKDKGLWTAVLAVVGCAVMLFNWLVINFVISGLHSYA